MDNWLKQTKESPLSPDLDWDKPERKDQAGKLLIVGGNLHGFAAPAKAFEYVSEQGIGYTRIALPDSLRSTLHAFWTDTVFCPSTPSGSFARDSKELILNNALWADGILLPGDLGRNSETAIMLDELMNSVALPLAITKDALDYYLARPQIVLDRKNTFLIASFSQLQKLLSHSAKKHPLRFTMPLAQLVGELREVTANKELGIVTRMGNVFVVAYAGMVCTTKTENDSELWRLETASRALVSALHHPTKCFEALNNSIIHIL